MTDIEKRCDYVLQFMTSHELLRIRKLNTSLITQMVNHKYKMNYTTSQIRNALRRLQRDGQVKINEAWSSGTHTTWELVK